jgi:hypothetical protein
VIPITFGGHHFELFQTPRLGGLHMTLTDYQDYHWEIHELCHLIRHDTRWSFGGGRLCFCGSSMAGAALY